MMDGRTTAAVFESEYGSSNWSDSIVRSQKSRSMLGVVTPRILTENDVSSERILSGLIIAAGQCSEFRQLRTGELQIHLLGC